MRIGRYQIEQCGALLLVAGPCVVEGADFVLKIAERLAALGERLGIPVVFKSSFDKANRTSSRSARGIGFDRGLEALARVKHETGLPVLTDVHETSQVAAVAEIVDVIQIPAFLSRQTDLLRAAGASDRVVNIKKGQFMAPGDMLHAAAKVSEMLPAGVAPAERIMLCERGTSFGYHDLVVDMRGLGQLRASGLPTLFDASHSVQSPGGAGDRSGGQRAATWCSSIRRAKSDASCARSASLCTVATACPS